MIHQLRIYEIFEHNKAAFHTRFRDHAVRIMKTYGFQILAMWETRTEKRTEFVYLLAWPDEPTMQEAWARFLADEEWKEIKRLTSGQYGDLVGEVESRVLLPPSPAQGMNDGFAGQVDAARLTDEVQGANLARSELIRFMAHELKNPMTSIKGYAELLAAGSVGAVNEMQLDFLNTIRANVERMSALVSNLNDYAKIAANNLRLDFKPVDLPDILHEALRSIKRQVEQKGQTLEVRVPSQLPLAWADSIRVGQILTDLLQNANQYTPEGGKIVIGAEVIPNPWEPNGAGQVVHFWVEDNGIGIRLEEQSKIFQQFFRSEDPKAREVPGAGLSLHIRRHLLEMMGGRIWFESAYGKGTTFHITIPVAEG